MSAKSVRKGLAIVGLHFYARSRDMDSGHFVTRDDEPSGIYIGLSDWNGNESSPQNLFTGLLIEDNKVEHFDTGIRIYDRGPRVYCNTYHNYGKGGDCPASVRLNGRITATVHRNIVRFSHTTGSHAVGMYIEGNKGSVFSENFIDHSGWHPGVVSDRNKKSHGIYAQSINAKNYARGNIVTRSAAEGYQFRAGADITDNVFIKNSQGFWTGVTSTNILRNVIMDNTNIRDDNPSDFRGWGMGAFFMASDSVTNAQDNFILNKLGSAGSKPAMALSGANGSVAANNVVHNWMPVHMREGASIELRGQNLDDKNGNIETFAGEEDKWVDAGRNAPSYMKSLGFEESYEAFYEALAAREAGEWIPALSAYAFYDYIEEGFTLK